MSLSDAHKRVTGFSGNEIYCLKQAGYRPGRICFGNSVMSLGVSKGLGSVLSNLGGGEVEEITSLIHEARENSYQRMLREAESFGGAGVAGISFDVINHAGQIEFITVGSTLHDAQDKGGDTFSSSASGQGLYCQLDAGFQPKDFVFANIAYSIGVGGNIGGMVRGLKRGEIPQFTKVFDHTRHENLERIKKAAKAKGANAVLGINTTISPFLGAQEMMMLGTAAHHDALRGYANDPITTHLTNQELWNLMNMGYMPIKLVMGVSVYSLGLAGGVSSMFQSLGRGEIETTTVLLHEARDKALERIHQDALAVEADEVVGVRTRIFNMGNGIVECMVLGTAVKKMEGLTTKSAQLPAQAFTKDEDTFFDNTATSVSIDPGKSRAASASKTQKGPISIIFSVLFLVIYIWIFFHTH